MERKQKGLSVKQAQLKHPNNMESQSNIIERSLRQKVCSTRLILEDFGPKPQQLLSP